MVTARQPIHGALTVRSRDQRLRAVEGDSGTRGDQRPCEEFLYLHQDGGFAAGAVLRAGLLRRPVLGRLPPISSSYALARQCPVACRSPMGGQGVRRLRAAEVVA